MLGGPTEMSSYCGGKARGNAWALLARWGWTTLEGEREGVRQVPLASGLCCCFYSLAAAAAPFHPVRFTSLWYLGAEHRGCSASAPCPCLFHPRINAEFWETGSKGGPRAGESQRARGHLLLLAVSPVDMFCHLSCGSVLSLLKLIKNSKASS